VLERISHYLTVPVRAESGYTPFDIPSGRTERTGSTVDDTLD
jgi:hypothetical protein